MKGQAHLEDAAGSCEQLFFQSWVGIQLPQGCGSPQMVLPSADSGQRVVPAEAGACSSLELIMIGLVIDGVHHLAWILHGSF